MNTITKYNLNRYDNNNEFDIYSNWKNHKIRIDIIVNLVNTIFKNKKIEKNNFKIIDIGGNTGVISKLLKDKGYNCICQDISKKALSKAKKKGIKTFSFDFNEPFPIKDNTYDIVIAGEVIEHVLDVEFFLNECNRILKDDGKLILTTPNLATWQDRIRFLFGKMPRQINPHHEYLKLHIRQFSYSGLKTSLNISNFEIEKLTSNCFALEVTKNKTIMINWLAKLFPKLSSSLIVVAKKTVNN